MYYKRFDIPYLKKYRIPLIQSNLSYTHEHNTLIIKYLKPDSIIKIEKERYDHLISLIK